MTLTQTELAAIRARAEKATEGEWVADDSIVIAVNVPDRKYNEPTELADVSCGGIYDAEFIAHAREDVPKLLAEVERLKSLMTHISEMAECFYEVDTEAPGEVIVMKVRADLENYRDFIQEILVVSSEAGGTDD